MFNAPLDLQGALWRGGMVVARLGGVDRERSALG